MADTTTDLATTDDPMGFTSASAFALLQRAGQLLAASSLVPEEYRNSLPNCVIALNMASRIGADPLMVMQNLHIVHGRPGWSAQFLIATFNQNGRFSAIRYEWVGEPGQDTRGCRAWAVEKSTGERLMGSTITLSLAKREGWSTRSGSKWLTMPDQMLMYRAAAWFIRAYAPEIAMGLHTTDELQDRVIEAEVVKSERVVVTPDSLSPESLQTAAVTGQDGADPGTPMELVDPRPDLFAALMAEFGKWKPAPSPAQVDRLCAELIGADDMAKADVAAIQDALGVVRKATKGDRAARTRIASILGALPNLTGS